MTTNPERLWCLKDREDGAGFVFAWDTEERASYGFAFGRRKPVQAYVREDIAAAAVTNAPGYETAMAEANRASRLEDETAALRAEVEALRGRNKDLRGALLAIQKGAFYDSHWSASDVMRVVSKAVQLDDDAAAKGVG